MQSRWTFFLLVLLAWISSGCSQTTAPLAVSTTPTPEEASGPVFKTPEEAIAYYFEGLAQSDINKITQSCAINEMSEKFNFALYTERLGDVFIPFQSLSPTSYPLYVEINRTHLTSQLHDRVKIVVYSLLSSENVADIAPINDMDAERTSRFEKDIDPKKLSSIAVQKIDLPNKLVMSNARYLENAAKLALIYGADESTERVALFSFEQRHYYLGFTLLRYGNSWKISSPTSPLAGTNAVGTPEKTTVEAFERMTSE